MTVTAPLGTVGDRLRASAAVPPDGIHPRIDHQVRAGDRPKRHEDEVPVAWRPRAVAHAAAGARRRTSLGLSTDRHSAARSAGTPGCVTVSTTAAGAVPCGRHGSRHRRCCSVGPVELPATKQDEGHQESTDKDGEPDPAGPGRHPQVLEHLTDGTRAGPVAAPRQAVADFVRRLSDMLLDTFGRVATDLRVSLTDRCNLRCSYCMPAEGLPWLPGAGAAHRRRAGPGHRGRRRRSASRRCASPAASRCSARASSTSSRAVAALPQPPADVADHQRHRAADRRRARFETPGSTGSTCRSTPSTPNALRTLTRRDRHRDVLAGLAAADAAGLRPVKVNTVLMRGVNDDEAVALLRWCLDRGYSLRFIEQMPWTPSTGGTAARWSRRTRSLRTFAPASAWSLNRLTRAAARRPSRGSSTEAPGWWVSSVR